MYLVQAFNVREGLTRVNDTLPKKLFNVITGGVSDGISMNKTDLELTKNSYYEMAEWDVNTAAPTQKTLERLGLQWVSTMLFEFR